MSAYARIKRALDAALSLLLMAALSPVFLLVALAVKLTSKGPVLFLQKRVGRGGRLFTILKFRTMRLDTPRDTATHLLNDPERFITPIGAFLRKSSLDELPQLWNVLRGDMSLIGPRPALYNQYDLIEAREIAGVNAVRPGLTGWAQINGRDELPIPVKVRYDEEYVKNFGFRMDVRCFFGSIACVLNGAGVREGRAGGKKSA
ncbi:MAG: sugar transferase [Clostridiales bacterium]|jgi:O-antigen biosynthesis protein WbqP|nr:sugar transferase [Clostridiales bacterium]OPZ69644.1 MAG: Undecaprenyl phosphate N,N'-diacetylbacillosamine 1-phosphate transferase [Firmicutes bacterium ADurb.Bin467]